MNRYHDIYAKLEQWLLTHIAALGCANGSCRQAFELKRVHSFKVADEITVIGRRLGLDAPALLVAKTIGLLHDAGRFQQFKTYGTFNDFASLDHGDLGERTVTANGLLADFDPLQRAIIAKSIRYHNKKCLPTGESESVLFFTRLIRDADKLDIYRVVAERIRHEAGTLPGDISEALVADLMAGGKIDYKRVRNAAEMRVMHISWIFDINFEPTFRLIRERNYLDILASSLPAAEEIDAFIRQARSRLFVR
jgi:HD domain